MANLFKTNKAGGAAPSGNVPITIDNVGTTSDIDVAGYATASVTTQGLYKPTTVKDNTGSPYTTNGTKTITGLENYSGVKINVNVSASLSETTLWTNSSPSSTFSAQTVTLSSAYTNFIYVKIDFYARNDNARQYTEIIPVSILNDYGSDYCATIGSFNGNVGTCSVRAVKSESPTTIYFTAAYLLTGSTVGTVGIIPVKISGLK